MLTFMLPCNLSIWAIERQAILIVAIQNSVVVPVKLVLGKNTTGESETENGLLNHSKKLPTFPLDMVLYYHCFFTECQLDKKSAFIWRNLRWEFFHILRGKSYHFALLQTSECSQFV